MRMWQLWSVYNHSHGTLYLMIMMCIGGLFIYLMIMMCMWQLQSICQVPIILVITPLLLQLYPLLILLCPYCPHSVIIVPHRIPLLLFLCLYIIIVRSALLGYSDTQDIVKFNLVQYRVRLELGKVCFFTVVHFVTYNPTVTICSDPTVHSHLGITDT